MSCTGVTPQGQADLCTNFPDFYNNIIVNSASTMQIEDFMVDLTGTTENLHLFRLTEVNGTACDAVGSEFGPILLMPDCFEDASSWFIEGEVDESFPAKLCAEGFDVWFLNPKSAQPSGTTTNTASFYNDSFEDYSQYLTDVNALILDTRLNDANSNIPTDMENVKTKWLAKGCGAQQAANWLANNNADTATSPQPDRLVTLQSCHVPGPNLVSDLCTAATRRMLSDESGRDLSTEDFSFETDEDARMLRHRRGRWDPWNPWNPTPDPWADCEPDAFYAELRRLKYEVLTYAQYRVFYNTLVHLRAVGGYGPTYCEPNWRDIMNTALCAADATQPTCLPAENKCLVDIFTKLRDTCNTHSIYGANWWSDANSTTSEQAEGLYCLCNGDDADDFTTACAYFEAQRAGNDSADYEDQLKEMDLTMYEHLLQQSLYGKPTKFSTTWATDGWYNEPASWDYSAANRAAVMAVWLNNEADPRCPVDLNEGAQNSFPATSRVRTYDFDESDRTTCRPAFLDSDPNTAGVQIDDALWYGLLSALGGKAGTVAI